MARITRQSGAALASTTSQTLSSNNEQSHEKTLLDISVVRFPTANDQVFKVSPSLSYAISGIPNCGWGWPADIQPQTQHVVPVQTVLSLTGIYKWHSWQYVQRIMKPAPAFHHRACVEFVSRTFRPRTEVIEKFTREVMQKAIGEADALYAERESLRHNLEVATAPVADHGRTPAFSGGGSQAHHGQPAASGNGDGEVRVREMLETPRKDDQ